MLNNVPSLLKGTRALLCFSLCPWTHLERKQPQQQIYFPVFVVHICQALWEVKIKWWLWNYYPLWQCQHSKTGQQIWLERSDNKDLPTVYHLSTRQPPPNLPHHKMTQQTHNTENLFVFVCLFVHSSIAFRSYKVRFSGSWTPKKWSVFLLCYFTIKIHPKKQNKTSPFVFTGQHKWCKRFQRKAEFHTKTISIIINYISHPTLRWLASLGWLLQKQVKCR